MFNALPSEQIALLGIIDPDANTAATHDRLDRHGIGRRLASAIIMAGDLGSSATIDAKFQQAQDSGGTGAKDVTGKAITQLTQAGTDKSNKQAMINLRAEELDRPNGFTHARLSMTTATATSDSAAIVLGIRGRYSPIAQPAAVIETVE